MPTLVLHPGSPPRQLDGPVSRIQVIRGTVRLTQHPRGDVDPQILEATDEAGALDVDAAGLMLQPIGGSARVKVTFQAGSTLQRKAG